MPRAKKLPRPSPGKELKLEDKIRVSEAVCELYALNKYSLDTCLKKYGIKSFSTWYKWLEIEEIEKLYKTACEIRLAQYKITLQEKGKTALEKWVDGFTVTEVKVKKGKNDKGNLVILEETKTTKHKQSIQATFYVLNNFDRSNFSKNPRIEKGEETGFIFTGFRFVLPDKPVDSADQDLDE